MKNNVKKVPSFSPEEEGKVFWEQHDLALYGKIFRKHNLMKGKGLIHSFLNQTRCY